MSNAFIRKKMDKIKSRFNCTIALADQVEFYNWKNTWIWK